MSENSILSSEFRENVPLEIIGKSKAAGELRHLIDKVARVNTTVLITGESGTGKELIARSIYLKSGLNPEPFIAINCGAIPDLLLESELFGHEKGAFTGAYKKRIGKFELAGSGIIFLDEISNMPDVLQAKLLRVLQERELERIGGNQLIKINARIIAATNVNLQEKILEGKFREDLFYRLNVVHIHIPPLRERIEDLEPLVDYFLKLASEKFGTPIKQIAPDAFSVLQNYSWPGNVRELGNLIERLVLFSEEDMIQESDLPLEVLTSNAHEKVSQKARDDFSIKKQRDHFEKEVIVETLRKTKFNQTKTAKILNIHRNTLLFKLNQLNIDVHELKKEAAKQNS